VISLIFRPMLADERNMVLSDWKKDLWDARCSWARGLLAEEWWALMNHVVDDIVLPKCDVLVGTHAETPDVALLWAATREGRVLHKRARFSIQKEPQLAAALERHLHIRLAIDDFSVAELNPFAELRRLHPKESP